MLLQNRNSNIVLMWMHTCRSTAIEKVDHKFMVSTHSFFLPNDSNFRVCLSTNPKIFPVKPISFILISKPFCQTISKALVKSTKTATV